MQLIKVKVNFFLPFSVLALSEFYKRRGKTLSAAHKFRAAAPFLTQKLYYRGQIKFSSQNPVAHCWSEPSHLKRKFCCVCRKRTDEGLSVECESALKLFTLRAKKICTVKLFFCYCSLRIFRSYGMSGSGR